MSMPDVAPAPVPALSLGDRQDLGSGPGSQPCPEDAGPEIPAEARLKDHVAPLPDRSELNPPATPGEAGLDDACASQIHQPDPD